MCSRFENGAWPIHCAPSPPIWVKPTVERSIHSAMKWQPMPAPAIEPSGTLVEVLCGQPEQKKGVRGPMSLRLGEHRLILLQPADAGRDLLRRADDLEHALAERDGDVVGVERALGRETASRRARPSCR